MPDHFIIAGAQRCGTTYLARLLDEHPHIEMAKPFRPEPKYFLDDDSVALGLDHYEATFFKNRAATVLGEKGTSYLEAPRAAERIRTVLPSATVFVVLRDPLRRAMSNYRFSAHHGLEDLAVDEALRRSVSGERPWNRDRTSVSPFAYLPRGRYIDYLAPFAAALGARRLRVIFYEELIRDDDVVRDVYDRLGVDPSFVPPSLGSVVNASECDQLPEAELESEFRDYFRVANRALEQFLGRPLPWP
jgi:hypothetical protein